MDQNAIHENKKELEQIFIGDKTNIEVAELQKYLDSKSLMVKIPEGIVHSISKQSYRVWKNNHDKNINKLLLYQIYDQVYAKCKQKPDQMEKSINQYDDKLKKIAEPQIQITAFKEAFNQHQDGHIYNTYFRSFNKYTQGKNDHPKQINKKQQQSQLVVHTEKQAVRQQKKELNLNQGLGQIFQQYCITESIQAQNLILLKREMGEQIDIEKVKLFKAEHTKVIDEKQPKYSLDSYRKWMLNKSRAQKKKEQKDIQISEVEQKGEKKKERISQNIEKMIKKYFKPIEKPPKAEHPYSNFEAEFRLDCSDPFQNIVDYQVKIMVGEKQVTQFISAMCQKKLIDPSKQNQYYLLKISTKQSQQLEERIQSYIKMKKINTQGYKLKTFTEPDKIYVSFQFKDSNRPNFLSKMYEAISQKKEQNHCKIQQTLKFGIGNEAKQKPEDRKLIKCLAKGFEFNFNISGSSDVNYRFRKNLQLQNSTSYLFPILAISKNSSLKMRWKKIEDLNSFFNKLGVLDALKTTPSIKQLIVETAKQIFHPDHSMDIISILQTILSQHETSQISLISLNQKAFAQLSLNNYVKNLLKK